MSRMQREAAMREVVQGLVSSLLASGLTRRRVASQLEVSERTIERWQRGQNMPMAGDLLGLEELAEERLEHQAKRVNGRN